jgi:RNA polymerase sigma-B factor
MSNPIDEGFGDRAGVALRRRPGPRWQVRSTLDLPVAGGSNDPHVNRAGQRPLDRSRAAEVTAPAVTRTVPARPAYAPIRAVDCQSRPGWPALATTVQPTNADLSDSLAILVHLNDLAVGDVRRGALRSEAIESYMPLAVRVARRYGGRGEPVNDLVQVAMIGLINAIDRFDVERGVSFASFAIPTINGEVKRYFRDKARTLTVPRRVQELSVRIIAANERLSQALRRFPSTLELAATLGVSTADIQSARLSAGAYRPLSLDRTSANPERLQLIDAIGDPDPRIAGVDDRETLRLCLGALPDREQQIITMRFVGGMTQSQIAERLGLSQMHISRLLTRSLRQLRASMLGPDDIERSAPVVATPPVGQPTATLPTQRTPEIPAAVPSGAPG